MSKVQIALNMKSNKKLLVGDYMVPYEEMVYPCPFCHVETLKVIYRPSYLAAKRSWSAAAGSKTTWRRIPEGIFLLSDRCSNCGKTAKEIERKLKGILII